MLITNQTVKVKKLEIGTIYFYAGAKTEGYCRAGVYLGKSVYDKFMFYNVGCVMLSSATGGRYMLHEDVELQYLIPKAKAILQQPDDRAALTEVISKPTIFGVIPLYSPEEIYRIFAKKKLMGATTIELNINNERKEGYLPVKAKDLVIGNIYVGSQELGKKEEGWRNTYVYLGRTKEGKFGYLFIGSANQIMSNTDLIEQVDRYWQSPLKQDFFTYSTSVKKLYRPVYNTQALKCNCKNYIIDQRIIEG